MMNNSDHIKIGDEGITFLSSFPSLQKLHLYNNKITKNGVEALSKMKFPLEYLNLGNKVDILGENEIGDKAMISLHRFPQLR